MTGDDVVADFVAGLDPRFAAIVDRLVDVLGSSPRPLDAALKWRRLTFARDGDFHHWVCAIAVTKKAVALNFHFGGLLDDPDSRFISGTSKFLRKLEFPTVDSVDGVVVLDFLGQALGKLQYFKDNWKDIQAGTRASKG